MATYLGFDLSLTATGVGVLKDGVASGHVIKPGGLKGVVRLARIRKLLMDAINEHRADLVGVAIEGYSMGSKGRTFDLGELGGVVRFMCYEQRLPTAVVSPGTLKMLVAGKGNASKKEMIDTVNERYSLHVLNDNVADGIGLAEAAWRMFGPVEEAQVGFPHAKALAGIPVLPTTRSRLIGV